MVVSQLLYIVFLPKQYLTQS